MLIDEANQALHEKTLFEAAKTEFLGLIAAESVLAICYPDSKPDSGPLFLEDMKRFKEQLLSQAGKNLMLSTSRVEILYRLEEQLCLKQAFPEAKSGMLLEGLSGKGKSTLLPFDMDGVLVIQSWEVFPDDIKELSSWQK